jgi:PBP1b-binding outer membrane lipoprotein LpoB
MKNLIYILIILISFFLLGCSNTGPSKKYANEQHLHILMHRDHLILSKPIT